MSDISNVIPIKRVIGRPMAKGFDERRNLEGRPRVRFSRVEFAREMAQKYKEDYEKIVKLNIDLALNSPDISVQQKCMDRAHEYALALPNADIAFDADMTDFTQNSEMSVLTKEDELEIKTFIAEKIKAKRLSEQMNKE